MRSTDRVQKDSQDLYPEEQTSSTVEVQALTTQDLEEKLVIEDGPSNPLDNYFKYQEVPCLQSLVSREYLIYNNTFVQSSYITLYPWSLLMHPDKQISSMLTERFRLMRADIRVRVLLTAPITTYGMVCITPFYNMILPDTNRPYDTHDYLSAPGVIILDVSKREAAEFVIPYVSPMEYMPLYHEVGDVVTDPRAVYKNGFVIICDFLKTIAVNVDAPSVKIQVWANFENIKLAAPYRQRSYAEGHMFKNVMADPLVSMALGRDNPDRYVDEALKSAPVQGTIERGSKSVDEQTSKTSAAEALPTRVSAWGNLTTSVYNQNAQFMGSRNIASSSSLPIEGPVQEIDLLSACKVPCLNDATEMVEGGLFRSNVLPTTGAPGWWPSIKNMYRLWRGSVKVHFRFITSPLVTGRIVLKISWSSTHQGAALVANLVPGDTYSEVISIQGTKDHFLTVPYINWNHWYMNESSPNFSQGMYPVYQLELDQLLSATETVPTLGVYMWISAADDLVFRYPQSIFAYPSQEAEGHMDLNAIHASDSNFPSITGGIPPVVDEQEATKVTDVLLRYSKGPKVVFGTRNVIETGVADILAGQIDDDTSDDMIHVVPYYMCRFTSGSIRYKVKMKTLDVLLWLNSFTASSTSTTRDVLYRPFDGITALYDGIWQIAEFELPYCETVPMWPVHEFSTSYSDPGMLLRILEDSSFPIYMQDAKPVTTPDDVETSYCAAGGDFKMYVLNLPPPPLQRWPLTLIKNESKAGV